MTAVFEKGMRVRVVDGENEGVEGDLFWIGQSKYGPEMRAGVTSDEDESQVWVMAGEMRAINEDGEELDPQPRLPMTGTPAKDEYTIRAITVPFEMARLLTAIRIEIGYPPRKAASATVRMDLLQNAEQQLGCPVPDAVIAYIAAGVGSRRSKEIGSVCSLTRRLLDSQHPDDDRSLADSPKLAFDEESRDFLVFNRGTARDSHEVERLGQHDGWEDGAMMSIVTRLADIAGEVPANTEPFELVIDYVTVEESEVEETNEQWISHKKFGRGHVTDIEPSSKGDKLTIEFEDGETRKLLARFIEFE